MNELALFSGAGGGILAGKVMGWRTVCAVEQDPYCIASLAQRQNEGILSPFPIWDDVCTFDGRPWREIVDVVSGGFPCQDLSSARTNTGQAGKGLAGEKSGLWGEMLRIIEEVRPAYAFIENSPNLRTKGLDVIAAQLSEVGYDCAWSILSARSLGANHERKRMWIVATDPDRSQCERGCISGGGYAQNPDFGMATWWQDQPGIHGVDDGVAYRVDRLKAIGNGQVPQCAVEAFLGLSERLRRGVDSLAESE